MTGVRKKKLVEVPIPLVSVSRTSGRNNSIRRCRLTLRFPWRTQRAPIAFNAEQSELPYILAVMRVESGFAQEPAYVRNPTGIFGAEPGFTEVSRVLNLSKILAAGEAPR